MQYPPEIETAQLVRTQLSRRSHARPLPRNDLTMDTTVHDPRPETIGEPLGTHSENSDTTEHWSDQEWSENPLPVGVTRRMAEVDRALQAMGVLGGMLHRDWRGITACEEQGIPYAGLSQVDREGLMLALGALQVVALDACAMIRTNTFNICGARP